MPSLLPWLDQQTGLVTALGNWFQRPVAGGPTWRFVWPATIAFTFVVQAITGLVIWMYYSPGAKARGKAFTICNTTYSAAGCSARSTIMPARRWSC